MSARHATLRKVGFSPNAGYAKAVDAMGMSPNVTTELCSAGANASPPTTTIV